MSAIPVDLAATLVSVVDEGSLDAAARRLHITPSAVSQRLRQLEERTGQVLLVRSKPARATAAGEQIVRFARQVALLAHDTDRALGGADAARIRLSLAVNADSLGTWFLDALAPVSRAHPVTFDLHRDDQDFTIDLLSSGSVMAAVTSRAEPVAGCRVRPLGLMRYEAVATPEFIVRELAGDESEALALAPLVDFDRKDDLQSRWLRARGVDPASPPRHYVPASQDFAHAVRRGLGWGLLPTLQSAGPLADGSLVRLGGPAIDVPLYWQQWNLRSETLDAVADAVVSEAARVLDGPVSPR